MRTSTNQISSLGTLLNGYDYKNQAWVLNARYQNCNHPANSCNCYGRQHAGQLCRVDSQGNIIEAAANMTDDQLGNLLAVEALAV